MYRSMQEFDLAQVRENMDSENLQAAGVNLPEDTAGETREIAVSVICLAYNHEAYIRQTLESFVMQETSFTYEVLVHDDASTDKTAEIIKEYERKYPKLIRAIYQSVNQYSRGIKIGEVFLHPKVRGKYIALCEGDDYWASPYKLQKEYEALEAHPQVDICAHSSWILSADGTMRESVVSDCDTVLTAGEVISGLGDYVNTNTLMYRARLDDKVPDFRKEHDLDYTLQIHGSLRGGMYYLHELMSVYRTDVPGSLTNRNKDNPRAIIAHLLDMVEMLECLNRETNGQFKAAVELAQYQYKRGMAFLARDFRMVKGERLYREERLRSRFALYLGCRWPALYRQVVKVYTFIRQRR